MESGGDAIDARGAADVPAVPAVRFSTEPNRRDPEIVRSFMRRLVVVFTAAAVALLLSIAWEVTRTAPDVDLSTGPGLWFLMGLAWIGAFAASLWFVPPAWSGLCLAAVAGALATLSGAVAESVDSTERPYLWGLEGSSVALRFATSCAFVLLLVWAAWSMVPSVHRRSPVWLQVVAGVGALVLLVVAWRLVPDAGVAFD